MKHMSPEETIAQRLKLAAQKAGMHDLDGLKLADLSRVRLEDDGVTVKGADELVASFKDSKPYLFAKHVRDMSDTEKAAKLAELKREPRPVPVETTKRASEMSEVERQQYLAEHRRRFG